MAVNIKAVLEDKTKYPDDAKFTLGGEELTFAELRRQNAESHGDIERQLTARSQELDNKQRLQEQAVTTLATVLERVSLATGLTYDQLVKGEIPPSMKQTVAAITQNTPTAGGIALKDDPLYKPLIDSVLTPMSNDVGLLKQALGTAINAYRDDHARLGWMDYLLSPDKPKDFSAKYEDVLQTAVNKGYKDSLGFPDVGRAAREMAGPVIAKADTEKVRKEGYDEGYKKAQAEFLGQMGAPQPGTGGISFEAAPTKGKDGKVPTIREQLDEAFKDPATIGAMFGGSVQ